MTLAPDCCKVSWFGHPPRPERMPLSLPSIFRCTRHSPFSRSIPYCAAQPNNGKKQAADANKRICKRLFLERGGWGDQDPISGSTSDMKGTCHRDRLI